jgi:hypothetical protein
MRRVAIALAAVALVVGAAGCGGDGDDASEEATTTGVASSDAERMEVKGEDFVEIAMHDEFFKSAILVGTPGQTLTINLKNEGAAAHTFTVDDQLVDEEVQPGGVGQDPRDVVVALELRKAATENRSRLPGVVG